MIRSQKVLRHAKGQPCQLALPGICSHDPDRTVFAHLNGAAFGKGGGMKAHDFAGFFSDDCCHMAYDLHTHGLSDAELSQALLKAVIGTWLVLIEDGVIIVPIDPKPARTIKPRKPVDKRTPIAASKHAWPSKPLQGRGWEKKGVASRD